MALRRRRLEHFGRAREAHQCCSFIGLPNHDDHFTFRRYVSLKPFGGELAIAQNSRLCGMPDENCFTEAPKTQPAKHPKN